MRRLPNLASRPFINTRPVILVIFGAVLVGLVMLALNLRLFFSTGGTTAGLRERVTELEAQRAELEAQIEDDLAALEQIRWRHLEEDVEAANLVLRAHAFSWGRLLTSLESTLPYAVRLVRVAPSVAEDRTVGISLQGIAQSREAMLEFMANLLESESFEQVEPSGETLPEGAESAGYEFDLNVVYIPDQLRATEAEQAMAASDGEPTDEEPDGSDDPHHAPRPVPMARAAPGVAGVVALSVGAR